MITVVGLGYKADDLTLSGSKAINKAKKVYVKTFVTAAGKAVKKLRDDAVSFDEQFSNAENFDKLNDLIVEILLTDDCLYCTDGSGVDDPIVSELKNRNAELDIICGVSQDSEVLKAAPSTSYCAYYALDVVSSRVFYPVDGDLIVKEIDDKYIAAELKLKLLDAYGDADVYFVREGKASKGKLSDLDRQKKYGNTFSLLIPYEDLLTKSRYSFADLMKIVFILRSPNGCPWDKVQTHSSIRDCCLEEAYELVEAIDLNDLDKMIEESGDVLLQGIFHASIAESQGEFTVTDVISGISRKLVDRHLHIFGGETAANEKEAYAIWEKAKAKEKAQRTYTKRMLDVAPMPALMKAKKLQNIAAKSGFKSDRQEFYVDKLKEEVDEFLKAEDASEKVDEGGDLLFAAAALVNYREVEPELALMGTLRKFTERFSKLEKLATERGIDLKSLDETALIALYNEVKNG